MVRVTSAVIPDRPPDCVWHRCEVANKFLDSFGSQFVMTFQRPVDVVDVCVVVFPMVNLHRPRVDMWFERVIGVGKFWKLVRHAVRLLGCPL